MLKINKKALFVSILLALVSAVFLMQYVRSTDKPVEEKPKITIYTAVRSFKTGEEIFASDILEKKVDPDSVSLIGITNKEQIIGKIVRLPILAGEVFTNERIATREEMQLSWQIPEGKRAMNLFVNESNLFSDLLQVGDHVDIIATFEGNEEIKPFVTTIVLNIKILAIGSKGADVSGKRCIEPAKTIKLGGSQEARNTLCLNVGQYSLICETGR